MRLRMIVGRGGTDQFSAAEIDIVMALTRAIDAVSPEQAGVEPLRRIRRGALRRQHVTNLVIEGARVFLGIEIAAPPPPIGPGAGEAMEHLPRAGFAARPWLVQIGRASWRERG